MDYRIGKGKPIRYKPGTPATDKYFITEKGTIWSFLRQLPSGETIVDYKHPPRRKKQHPNAHGYMAATFHIDGKQKKLVVHRLVLLTYRGDPPEGHESCHGPAGKLDNSLSNLSWGTRSKNCGEDKVRDGVSNRGERQGRATLTEQLVRKFRRHRAKGKSIGAIAKRYGVGRSAVCLATLPPGNKWRTWKHVE